ncbi:MAG: hypothetical protein E7384_07975 [Ruminococcaceae bacterium]|nr:hypothetical protein [Oscillospiraceae bacterium]
MKKIICLLLLLAMLVSVAACEKGEPAGSATPTVTSTQSTDNEPSPSATVDEETEATESVVPTETSTPSPTAKPTATVKPVEKTPEPVDRGTLSIENVYAFLDYPASNIYPKFSIPKMAEKLTYTFDGNGIKIDADKNTVTAVTKGTYTVTASSENFKTTFSVYVKEVNKNVKGSNGELKFDTSKFTSQAANRLSQWEKDGVDGKTTLFIGDSFFDSYFWSDFYTKHYAGKDALLLGIGSTTTYDWEVWADEWLGKTSPKNIVINVGTNNVYDDGDNVNETIVALKRLFLVLHNKFPDTQIYWYGISQRAYGTQQINMVTKINRNMKDWCDLCDYVTYLDATSKLTADKLKDGVHPKLEQYSIFTRELSKTDIVIEKKSGN